MRLREQLLGFNDLRKVLLRLEFSEHGSEHLGYRIRSVICLVQPGKFKRAAQLADGWIGAGNTPGGAANGVMFEKRAASEKRPLLLPS